MRLLKKQDNITSVVVLDDGTVNTLGVLRCFGQRKIPVILLSSLRKSMCRYSKYGIKELFRKNIKNENDFIEELIYISKKYPGQKLLFPTFDLAVLYTFKNKEILSEEYLLPPGDFNILDQLINKGNFYKLIQKYNIDFPSVHFIEEASEDEITFLVEYPCIVKPCDSYSFQKIFGIKSFKCSTKESLREKIRLVREKKLKFIIQKYINSHGLYMFYAYFDKSGQVKGICGYDKIRQFPPDFGSGCFCITQWREDLIYPTVRFLENIGFKGIAEPEFIRDPENGKYKLLEINARSSTQNRLPAAAGLDIEYMLYCDVIGKRIEKKEIKNGSMAWIEIHRDILSFFGPNGYMKRSKDFFDYLLIFKYKKIYGDFSREDIKPFIFRSVILTIELIKYLFRKLRKLL